MPIIVENLYHEYAVGADATAFALADVSFSVERGEWLSIVGHTGSGKSTLAQHLNALLLPQKGSVVIDGRDVGGEKNVRDIRRKVGLVFQYPEQQFFANTVAEEITFGPTNWGVPPEEIPHRIQSAIDAVGLPGELLAANPFEMSGGQQRRVALASVIASQPDYLVLDEPTAGLDAAGRRELTALLKSIQSDGVAVIHVTHDLELALSASDKLLVLEEGRAVLWGTPDEAIALLVGRPVKGLVMPPVLRFASELARRGYDVPLSCDADVVVDVLAGERTLGSAQTRKGTKSP